MDETTVPVRLDGEVKGSLTVTAEGLLRRFDARCADPGRLVRLSVYGQGREGYLGVMEPENGALVLHRRLSRAETEAFPAVIEYAAEAGRAGSPPEPSPRREEQRRSAPRAKAEGDTLWRRVGDGSLYAETKEGRFRAIPLALHGLPTEKIAERRTIEGVEYALFRLENGRIP